MFVMPIAMNKNDDEEEESRKKERNGRKDYNVYSIFKSNSLHSRILIL